MPSALVFPDDFKAPSVADDVGLLSRVTPQQHKDLLELAKKEIADSGDGAWPAATGDTLRALWANHFTVDAVHWALEYARVALRLQVRATHSDTKAALADALVEAQVPPIGIEEIRSFVEKWKAYQSAAPVELAQEGAVGADGTGAEVKHGDNGCMRESTSVDSAETTSGESADGNDGGPSPAAPGKNFYGIMAKLMVRQMDFLERLDKKAEKKSPDMMLPLDKHLAETRESLRVGEYVDPLQLSDAVLNRLRFRLPGQARKERKLGDITLSTDGEGTDSSSWFNPVGLRQGFTRMVEMVLGIDEVKHRAQDMLGFAEEVWSFPKASEEGKARFIKHFLYKYRGQDDWKAKAFQDARLVAEFLTGDQRAGSAPSAGAKRQAGGGARPGPADKRQRGPGAGGGAQQGRGDRHAWKARQPCLSRMDPSRGDCSYPGCRFSHACVSCGQDHPANACSKWDRAKGKKALDELAARRRH